MRALIAFFNRLFRNLERQFIPLDEQSIDPDPVKQFQRWFDDAVKAKFYLAEAMMLATTSRDGKPTARMVLLKKADEHGFVFYTNYNSKKSKELTENPNAALLFHWPEMHCQVRVEGTVEKTPAEESDNYFQSRPRDSQIGALVSPQSEVIVSREELDRQFDKLKKEYEGRPIPRPTHWGGYRLKPAVVEFWQGRAARLHDRIVYELQSDGRWTIKRLAP